MAEEPGALPTTGQGCYGLKVTRPCQGSVTSVVTSEHSEDRSHTVCEDPGLICENKSCFPGDPLPWIQLLHLSSMAGYFEMWICSCLIFVSSFISTFPSAEVGSRHGAHWPEDRAWQGGQQQLVTLPFISKILGSIEKTAYMTKQDFWN